VLIQPVLLNEHGFLAYTATATDMVSLKQGGRGGTVKSRKQAIAIGLSEARKKGAKVPKKKK
jgi:hypothetical protein